MVPVPGGVLIQDGGVLLGAVGVSGDRSDNDEICAVAGIEAAGLKANAGALYLRRPCGTGGTQPPAFVIAESLYLQSQNETLDAPEICKGCAQDRWRRCAVPIL